MTTPPQRLGKYEIHEELGRGAFATVYRALDITLNREAALKVLHPPLLTDPAFIARFQREAQTMAKLDHRHIAAVYDVSEAEGRVYIALYLAQGPTLSASLAERGRFPWSQTLTLLQPICEALDYAHGRGVVHRDLKPANILLDSERGPIVTDFGFARLMGDSSISLSLSGGILGTPAYIAPEVWELDASAPPADIYALGCITCELLTGAVLFAGKTPMQAMRAHDQGPQFPPAWPEDAPPGIQAALSKALARDPAMRYASGAALWHALRDLETQAQAARETAEQAAVAAQWRAETEAAMAAGEWRAAKMAAARWLALAPGDAAAQTAAQRVETALAEEARHQQETVAAAAAARERERLQAAQQQAAAAARERYQAEQAAPVQPAVYTPVVQRPAPPKAAERKAFPAWGWVLVAIVGLMGGLWGLSSLGNKPPAEPTIIEKTVVVTQEVVKVVTATPTPTPDFTPTPRTTATPRPFALGDTWTRPADDMVLVYAPAGEFQMGSEDGDSDEKPVHTVALDAFWIDRTEVSNAQYQQCVAAGRCVASRLAGDNRYNGAQQPVVGVSWHDAAAYCAWAGGRLPTEAEWEYAARGPEGLKYPWGNTWQERVANCAESVCKDGYERTAPVGSFPQGASWVGAMDLAGNVWEWVADWYGSYSSGRQVNPTGPASGDGRVLRGGSWYFSEWYLRGAFRGRGSPPSTVDDIGFRCVASWSPGE